MESHPAVVQPLTVGVDRIPAGANYYIEALDLRLDAALLAGFTEASRLELATILEEAGSERARDVAEIRLLPPSHWDGGRSAPEPLAALVRPNDPAVDIALRDAATKLGEDGREIGLNGYAKGRKARAWKLAAAIWAAIADRSIAYILPPASFERAGQKVRGPSEVLERRVGTCLDLSLQYAACLGTGRAQPGPGADGEPRLCRPVAAGGSLLGRRRRHATPAQAPGSARSDPAETTLLTRNPPAEFQAATARGGAQVEDDAPAALEVRRCRRRGIRPMDPGEGRPGGIAHAPTAQINQSIAPPPFGDDAPQPPVALVPLRPVIMRVLNT